MALLVKPHDLEHGICLAQRAPAAPRAGPPEERTHGGVLAHRHRGNGRTIWKVRPIPSRAIR